jgi:hypothetical protein
MRLMTYDRPLCHGKEVSALTVVTLSMTLSQHNYVNMHIVVSTDYLTTSLV